MSKPQLGPGETVEWYTPPYIIQGVIRVLGAIDCDPCSNPPPYNVPAATHYTPEEDGLLQAWHGRVYMNPPYGDVLPYWLDKLRTEIALGHCSAAVTLTPANTETQWFQRLWHADALCFHIGRVQFIGGKSSGNVTGNVLGYFGADPPRFAEVFAPLGRIIYPNASYRREAIQPTLWTAPAVTAPRLMEDCA